MRLSCPSILPRSVARPMHRCAQMPPHSVGSGDQGLGKHQGMGLCQSTHPGGAGLEHGPAGGTRCRAGWRRGEPQGLS